MQYNFKLGRVVTCGFSSVFVVMVVIGIVSKLTTNKLVESNGWISHTYQVEGSMQVKQLAKDKMAELAETFLSGQSKIQNCVIAISGNS